MIVFWYLISILRTVFVLLMMIVWMLVYAASLVFSKHSKQRALRLRENWLKWVAIPAFGIRIEMEGILHDEPALYVANHRSFSDPLVICRYLPAFVVAKAEVANYPIINKGAQLTGVLYVKRENKDSRNAVRKMIFDTIAEGLNVLVFPEGTVGVKKGTLPFKKGAFAEAFRLNVPVIPIALEYKSPKDLWIIPQFIKQFIIMYAKPLTRVKMKIGLPIQSNSVEELVEKSQSWIENSLDMLQKGWTDIDFSKYEDS